MHYIAYFCEHLRDGIEESARIYSSQEAALDGINQVKTGFCAASTDCRLFELGREIPLTTESSEEPQPAKVVSKIVLKK